jgi:hypothetical protein
MGTRRYLTQDSREYSGANGAINLLETDQELPTPHYTLIDTSRGEHPAVAVINSALRSFNSRHLFPWHLKIEVACQWVGSNGMPTQEEGNILYTLEEHLASQLGAQRAVLFVSRITCQAVREISFRVSDPKTANEVLQIEINKPAPVRAWEYRMEEDPEWKLASPELNLINKDTRFN